MDKALGYVNNGEPFSKQRPWYAIEEKERTTGAGTGAPNSYSNGNGVENLQTWTMIDHEDVNRATAKEFG